MRSDHTGPERRTLLRVALGLGAATAVHLIAADPASTPSRPARTAGTPPAAAAGPPGQVRGRPSPYRLDPMTANTPPRYRPARPPVRTRPFEHLPELGHSMVLTFDDGPDPRYTPGILATLREHAVRAMFFVCGEMAEGNADLLREMADDGHVVGNHSWSHPLIPKLSRSAIRDELGRTSEVVERALGTAPLWYRAPYGAWNRNSFEIGAELGMEPMAWTVDTLDWKTPGTGAIVRRVLDGAAPGVVVLSHDAGGDRSQSVAALRRYLPRLLDSGYRITVPHRV
ncbi:polysaccharide deacetylase family protein [Streptomyces griseus]|uniref:Polysaccharide deacetylase family protein n=1 Tax=Streptomyces sp. CMC78 TaxID=3231512 RepID=A0AB33KGP8_9ACTN|nr:polysaccharide deacetylase family protein [Streptomyces sp. ID01-9D]MDX5577011.1 polysaccharide deacetylase family protein [Streptomyces sp. ID01-9D]WSV25452.1 polysaccharide deacetylase family protein [Streptomyces fimicarius]WTC85610.1 polysaccharide deacetylase family protein [Streptomyces griseus]WTD71772.1 polysaccharide deacetylase family protein [Streptomyces griseus]